MRLTDGVVATGNLEIRSNILGTGGLTKTGFAQVVLDGANTYTGLTTISDGTLFIRNGKSGLGAGGAGNDVVIVGNGSLSSGSGVQIGTAAAPENILVKAVQGDITVLRANDDLTNYFGDIIIDNVDAAGQTLFTPRISTGTGATLVINGDLYGGTSSVVNDIIAIDSRIVQFDLGGDVIFRGQIGDRGVAGAAAPIADTISTLPTLAGTRTNENEVLRVTLAGNIQTNFIFDQQYDAAGRLTNNGGIMLINYNPTAPGNDGTGFWTDTAISKIPLADSITTTFATNGSTNQKGFAFTNAGGLFLMRDGQSFNMASWASSGNATKTIGGLNESGTVTFGNGTGTLTIADLEVQLYAASGGTVLFNQRLTGSPGTAPENLGVLKMGRGTVILQNDSQVTASDTNLELGGGTLILDHQGGANIGRVGTGVVTFNGGVLLAQPHQSNPSTVSLATSNAANVLTRFFLGGTEIVAQTENGRNMTINIGNNNANGSPSSANLLRVQGGTANFVEWQSTPLVGLGVAQITLDFNSTTLVATKNAVIPWATYGTAPRTAIDFAMVDAANSVANDVGAFGRAADEYINNVAAWTSGIDVSESGGAGFFGTIASTVAVNTIRFDSNADSTVNIASGQSLSLIGDRIAGGILVTSNVGDANKTINGGTLNAFNVAFTGDVNFLKNYTGTLSTVSNVITGVSSTTGLVIGMPVTGTGIPAGATITAIDSGLGTVTLSATPTANGSASLTTDPADNLIYNVSSTANLSVGMPLSGTSVPAGSTITAINGNTITISANGTATTSGATLGSATPEIVFHQYSTGKLIVNSVIANDASGTPNTPVGVTITGPSSTGVAEIGTTGAVVLNGINTYSGRTVIGGAVLEFSSPSNLGTLPSSAVTNQITLNGGTLRYTATGMADLGANRGVRIEGNGGVIDVVDPSGEVRISGDLNSLRTFQGDLVKVGAGTLTLGATNNANFGGLIDVRQGTLRLNSNGTGAAGATTILGTNASVADSTIFRTGTNFAIQMSNGDNTGDWTTEEWLTFEGSNYITIGTPNTNLATPAGFDNPSARAAVNLYGVNTVKGTVTFDTVGTQIVRLNNGVGYTTGNGDIIKDGQGQLEFRGNIPDWTGNLVIKQGTVYAISQADMLGTGYLTGKTITLGSNDRQGTAQLLIQNPDNIQNHTFEINHDINVVYNPAQTKRLGFDNVSNGDTIAYNGDITLNDNLIVLMQDAVVAVGGDQSYVNFNGSFKDGATTSGNILFQGTDGGTANDNTNGRPVLYALLNGDNSLWTGDATISANTAYDQDKTTVVRLNHVSALTAANDVTMNFNSILQVGGGARAIGSLVTQGGNGPFLGDAGTMSASTNGSSEIIENAASTIGTLTINQSTPVAVEVVWDAKFRDGTLNSQFFAPGTNTSQPSAALNIVKSGSGWATLTLDNDYTGTTTVTGGILQVGKNNVGDTGAVGAGGLTVNTGATLAGTGIVQGTSVLQTGSSLLPGDLAGALMGTLTFNGDATLQTGTTTTLQTQRATYNHAGFVGGTGYNGWVSSIPADAYSFALSDPVLSTQHDTVNVLGSLTWSNGTKIVVSNNGYTPAVGDVFDLFDWFSVVGSVNVGSQIRTGTETGTDLDLFELGGDYRWDTSLFNSNGILVVTIPGLIPEPSRMMLLMFGLLGVFFRRRRQNRQA